MAIHIVKLSKMNNDEDLEESIIGFDALYSSMHRCKSGVIWKDSVAHYVLNGIEETIKLEHPDAIVFNVLSMKYN